MEKRRKKLSRKEREKNVVEEFQEASASKAESSRLSKTTDAELFVLDANGTGVRRRKKVALKLSAKPQKKIVSKRRSVPSELDLAKRKRRRDEGRSNPNSAFDKRSDVSNLWAQLPCKDADPWTMPFHTSNSLETAHLASFVTKSRASTKIRKLPEHAKTDACHPGISYNPQTSDHQDIVAAAVAVEIRRDEARAEKDPMWARAIAANSLAVVGSDDEVIPILYQL